MRPDGTFIVKAQPWSLAFGPVVLAAGEKRVVSVMVDRLFRGELIEVQESIKGATLIEMLTAGGRPQLPPFPFAVPSSVFARNPLSSGVLLDTCEACQSIDFAIHNQSAEPVTWSAEIKGKAVR